MAPQEQPAWPKRPEVKKLAVVHIGPHLSTHGPMEKGIGDMRAIYDGNLIFADELSTLEL